MIIGFCILLRSFSEWLEVHRPYATLGNQMDSNAALASDLERLASLMADSHLVDFFVMSSS